MSVRIVRDDYEDAGYEPLEVWANPPRDHFWTALAQWLRDDWLYYLFLVGMLLIAWIFGGRN